MQRPISLATRPLGWRSNKGMPSSDSTSCRALVAPDWEIEICSAAVCREPRSSSAINKRSCLRRKREAMLPREGTISVCARFNVQSIKAHASRADVGGGSVQGQPAQLAIDQSIETQRVSVLQRGRQVLIRIVLVANRAQEA